MSSDEESRCKVRRKYSESFTRETRESQQNSQTSRPWRQPRIPRKGSTCIPIRSTASTARSVRCWTVYWTPRRSRSEGPRAFRAPAATPPRAVTGLWDDVTLRSTVTEELFNGVGSDSRPPGEKNSLCLVFARLMTVCDRHPSVPNDHAASSNGFPFPSPTVEFFPVR